MPETGVALVGAGMIARTHAEALRHTPGARVAAVVDPNLKAAEALAAECGVKAYASVADALAADSVARAHVLVPPHLHAAVATPLLEAGVPCLVEKPLGATPAEARALVELAQARGVALGVNQNYIFHPAFARFQADLAAGRYGRLRFVSLVAALPLAQLAAKQFGHWMFERPANIVLEQMVHPLSQLLRLLGSCEVSSSVAAPAKEIAPGVKFHHGFEVSLRGAAANAQLHMSFGANYPTWHLTAVCDDGVAVVDGIRNTLQRLGRSRYLEAADNALTTMRAGAGVAWQGLGGVAGYGASQLRLRRRGDAFYRSLEASVRDFHAAAAAHRAPIADGPFGARIVELCDDISRMAGVSDTPAPLPRNLVPADAPPHDREVAVFGGTGFIGRAVVQQLLDAGRTVAVVGRSSRGLPACFDDPRVRVLRGDVTRRADIERGIGGAKQVVNLAHGGAMGSRAAMLDAMVGSARTVAEVCLERRVERLVFVSSIAALYLGDAGDTVGAATPADPTAERRADYSFAKAEAERVLLELHRERGLPVTIQRPGVVVGAGASPFHSGLGMFNNEQHCLGWNRGRNPLPFVLVEDVAAAIVAALKAGPSVHGRTDNIVGGVRLTAREYLDELKAILGRPLAFHGQSIWFQQAIELGKWSIKKVGGKRPPFPALRDLKSRGLPANFDTSDTEQALGWTPVRDRETFLERGVRAPARELLDA